MTSPRMLDVTINLPGGESIRVAPERCAGWCGSKPCVCPPRTLAQRLVADIAEGLRVFVTRDGVQLSEAQIDERARNIAQGLLFNDYGLEG